MTPFDRWYSANIAPTLPTDAPPEVLKLSRAMAASIWNAALRAAEEVCDCKLGTDYRNACGFDELFARGDA